MNFFQCIFFFFLFFVAELHATSIALKPNVKNHQIAHDTKIISQQSDRRYYENVRLDRSGYVCNYLLSLVRERPVNAHSDRSTKKHFCFSLDYGFREKSLRIRVSKLDTDKHKRVSVVCIAAQIQYNIMCCTHSPSPAYMIIMWEQNK